MISRYLRWQDGLSEFVGQAISWLSLAMIGVLIFEVVMRYFFRSPTIWAHELTTMLFGAFAVLGASYTLRHQAHVRSEVIWGQMRPRLRAACDVVVFTLGLLVLAVVFWQAVGFAARSWQMNEFSNRSVWQPPLYYIKSVIPAAIGLLIMQSLAELLRAVLHSLGVPFQDPRTIDPAELDAPPPAARRPG